MAVPGAQPHRRRADAATVVVEARERSGALITADLALDEGREVLAVPGEITSALSRGTNALLRLGAMPVTGAADVLEAIGVEPTPAPERLPLEPRLEAVLAALADAAATADEVAQQTGKGRVPSPPRSPSSSCSAPSRRVRRLPCAAGATSM